MLNSTEFCIFVDSSKRDQTHFPHASSFTYRLSPPLHDVVSLVIEKVIFNPRVFEYGIDRTCNTISISIESQPNSSIDSFICSGNYKTVDDVLSAISHIVMNNGHEGFQFVYENISNQVCCMNTHPYHIHVHSDSIFQMLGFSRNVSYSSRYNSETGLHIVRSPFPCTVQPVINRSIFIDINEFHQFTHPCQDSYQGIAHIQFNHMTQGTDVFQFSMLSRPIPRLDRLTLSLRHQHGALVDLHGADFVVIAKITQLCRVLGNNVDPSKLNPHIRLHGGESAFLRQTLQHSSVE